MNINMLRQKITSEEYGNDIVNRLIGKTLEELLEKQNIYDFILSRDKFIYNKAIKDKTGKIVVFGDTPTMNIIGNEDIGRIWYDEKHNYDKIGVDCGCGFPDGYLGCLRLNDMKEFYVY